MRKCKKEKKRLVIFSLIVSHRYAHSLFVSYFPSSTSSDIAVQSVLHEHSLQPTHTAVPPLSLPHTNSSGRVRAAADSGASAVSKSSRPSLFNETILMEVRQTDTHTHKRTLFHTPTHPHKHQHANTHTHSDTHTHTQIHTLSYAQGLISPPSYLTRYTLDLYVCSVSHGP